MLDDLAYDKKAMASAEMRELSLTSRHYNVFCIVCIQAPLQWPPQLRSNVDYVFALRDNNVRNRRHLHEGWHLV